MTRGREYVVRNERQIVPATAPVHLGFSEHREPAVRGNHRRYLLARGDQLAFSAEVVRLGFAPDDFVLDAERLPGSRVPAAGAPTFSVRVENIRSGHARTYLGGPGRAWVAVFFVDLMAGNFGQP